MAELGISEEDLVEGAYLDLHEGPGTGRGNPAMSLSHVGTDHETCGNRCSH